MVFLRNGGSAVDGVEMALKSLEDNEITNSGYGSNLSLDGTVECDASIMEESGRSGAVGAVDRKSAFFFFFKLMDKYTVCVILPPLNRLQKPFGPRPTYP